MQFLAAVGPDTLINTFVVNLKGNKDVQTTNSLQTALGDDLNYAPQKLNNERIPIILMHTGFDPTHGRALTKFKQRIGVLNEYCRTSSALSPIGFINEAYFIPYPTVHTFVDDILLF